ncbi:MAG: septum formation initiator family protein [Bacteroidales bacterium]|jgi:cell division protein FtsB|nr:septum formation initiator family protein [Bacteroidales bacterium]MDD3166528.1 septum formation initiator family protein [Bacteroidales bacterium]MDD4770318.1 septum formation initiator family protein [Bacteroidales bacterium]
MKAALKSIQEFWKKIQPYLNKYVVTIGLFVIFILFVDENNIIRRIQLKREIRALKSEIRQYEALRDTSVQRLEDLKAGKSELERIAREDYLMKRPNEEVFIIE